MVIFSIASIWHDKYPHLPLLHQIHFFLLVFLLVDFFLSLDITIVFYVIVALQYTKI